MKPFVGMSTYTTFDEWYSFKENPRAKVHVLASLDEKSIKNSQNDKWKMGRPSVDLVSGIRGDSVVFLPYLGTLPEAFDDENVRRHIAGGY